MTKYPGNMEEETGIYMGNHLSVCKRYEQNKSWTC